MFCNDLAWDKGAGVYGLISIGYIPGEKKSIRPYEYTHLLHARPSEVVITEALPLKTDSIRIIPSSKIGLWYLTISRNSALLNCRSALYLSPLRVCEARG